MTVSNLQRTFEVGSQEGLMSILSWSLKSQARFVIAWTISLSIWAMFLLWVGFAIEPGFPIEFAIVAGVLPIVGLCTGPIIWRLLVVPLLEQRRALGENADRLKGRRE